MTLYFQNSQGIEKEIGHPKTFEESFKIISDYLKGRGYKSFYTRVFPEEDNAMRKKKNGYNRMVFDVGSHSEFFILEGASPEEITWTI